MRIIFMGTPDFAVPVLQSLINSRHEVVAVVTQPDRPKGRGKNMQFSPVKECALAHNIPVMQPVNVSVPEVIDELRAYEPELIVVVAFGQFVTKKIREMPKYGCINVHASLLPKYRGAGPIQWAVINGEKESGVTTMYMCREIDKGDMLLKDTVMLDPKETGDSLHDKLSMMGGPLLLKTIDQLEDGSAVRIPQCEEESTYAPKLEKTMGNIDWTMDADRIERLVRGLNSWPGTFTKIHGKTVKIWDCDVVCQEALTESQAAAEPGTVIISEKDQLIVKAGNGALSLRMLQPEGKKNMTVDAYLRGYPIAQGEKYNITEVKCMPYYYWDPTYILVLIGALLSVGASALVNRTFNHYSSVYARSGLTGAQAAQKLLHSQGIYDVQIQHISGSLTDHYDPRNKTLSLSDAVYNATTVAAIGVAAHECGHAMQHAKGYVPLSIRSALVPVVNFGSYLSWPLIVIGLFINSSTGSLFLNAGLLLFSLVVLFQLVTLPVEINASRRAVRLLDQEHILIGDEVGQTARVLKAAALTYVASAAASILQLLRLLILTGGRRRDD